MSVLICYNYLINILLINFRISLFKNFDKQVLFNFELQYPDKSFRENAEIRVTH
jgi:hypothetical protein